MTRVVRWLLSSVLGVVFVLALALDLGASTWVAITIASGVGFVATYPPNAGGVDGSQK